MTPMPMMAAAAIPAMDPTLIPPESAVDVAVAALLVLLAVTRTVERVAELAGAVVLADVAAAGGVVWTAAVVDVEEREALELELDDTDVVVEPETVEERVESRIGGPVGSKGTGPTGVEVDEADAWAVGVAVVDVPVKPPSCLRSLGVLARLWTFLNAIFGYLRV